ncbi:MAG: acetate--CoA ligase family protein [Smithellaceae bacterium]
MNKLFFPESIIVFGVSPREENLAKNIVMNLGLFGYSGKVYCVGRDNGEVFGRTIYRSITEIGCIPDLAVFLIPAKWIPEAVDACGMVGIRRCVIESGGFSEFAEESKSLEEKILEIAARHNMRFMGPNCIGIINMENGIALPFTPWYPTNMKKGVVSVLAQSGGIVTDLARFFELENIGFSKMVSMGNKLDLDENDFLEYLVNDPATKIIIMHLESISNGERLMDIASTTTKPIIMIKANNSPGGREIARFHTSALASDDEVASAAFRQAGIHRFPNLQEALEFAKVLSLPPLKGPNLGILCRSGGQAVILADAAHKYGFHRAKFTPEFFLAIQKEFRAGVIRPTNPLDLGDIFDFNAYINILKRTISQDDIDGVLLYHTYNLSELELDTTKKLIKAAREISWEYGKPVIFFMISDIGNWFGFKRETDLPIFSEPDIAMKVLARSLGHQRSIRNRGTAKIKFADRPRPVKNLNAADSMPMAASSVYTLLEQYQLPVVPYAAVNNLEDCLKEAGMLGYPVALKMGAAEILHKTERQGVVLNIRNSYELEKEFIAMKARQGGGEVILQKMAPFGRELIIGGKRDREFGPVIIFGLGGILVELLKDVSMRVAPVSLEEAGEMVDEIKGNSTLKEFRGRAGADIDALVASIRKISVLITDYPEIKSIDVNPLILLDKGLGANIVDAKIEIYEG